MPQASILALSSAVPQHMFLQNEIVLKIIDILGIEESKAIELKKAYSSSAIQKRYSVISDFKKERSQWDFWGSDYPNTVPGMSKRNAVFKKEAPKLSLESASKAIAHWGGNPQDLTHLIFVSCTGVVAPGIEFELAAKLGLKSSVNRLGINFMGCFGAFKGLGVANAFAKENPNNRILVICTELCSIHFQSTLDPETLTANSLFSDGSAAAIVGAVPQDFEKPIWDIERSCSLAMENSLDKMTWEASDDGFLMRLSHKVPVLLGRNINSFANTVLGSDTTSAECDWAIHPGGKSILQAIEKATDLKKIQTQASWDILNEYGNMSSATFLFVLERLHQMKTSKTWTWGLGFGPGLSMEGLLLRKRNE